MLNNSMVRRLRAQRERAARIGINVASKRPSSPFGFALQVSARTPAATLFLLVTAFRIVWALPLVLTDNPLLRSLWLVTFIAWDVFDGALARRFTVDHPARRMVDAYVDRAMILWTVLVAVDHHWAGLCLAIVVIVRDIVLWVGLQRSYRRHGVVALGGHANRQAAWVSAGWAMAYFWTGWSLGTQAIGLLFAVSVVVVGIRMVRRANRFHFDPPRAVVID